MNLIHSYVATFNSFKHFLIMLSLDSTTDALVWFSDEARYAVIPCHRTANNSLCLQLLRYRSSEIYLTATFPDISMCSDYL